MEGGTFTSTLWSSISSTWEAIISHPFLKGLVDGSLSSESFQFYIIQDWLYLKEYSRGLGLIAAKGEDKNHSLVFAKHVMDTIQSETSMHSYLLQQCGSSEEFVTHSKPSPTCLLYTSYLMRVAYERPFHEILGAFLACYWIYWEVGKFLWQSLRDFDASNPYHVWIKNYADSKFGDSVKDVLNIVNEVSLELTEKQRKTMLDHFVTTSKMEYMFWDMAFKQEKWPV